jgi:hypothetical protein
MQENISFIFKSMYYITYYYLNSLSITDCNAIKKYPKGKHFSIPPTKENPGSDTAYGHVAMHHTVRLIFTNNNTVDISTRSTAHADRYTSTLVHAVPACVQK